MQYAPISWYKNARTIGSEKGQDNEQTKRGNKPVIPAELIEKIK